MDKVNTCRFTERIHMCGCNRGGHSASGRAAASARSKIVITPRLSISSPVRQQAEVTNNTTPFGMAEIPPPSGNKAADRQRILQLRKNAIQRSLGKLL